jgi:hypothetical protein
MKALRWLWRIARALITTVIVVINGRLYYTSYTARAADVPAQLAFIRHALENGAADEMQAFFPEGYFFSYALYGLAWTNIGWRTPALRETAIEQARWAIAALDSPRGRAPFSPSLDPPYGVFYVGWMNWLRVSVLLAQPENARDADIIAAVERDSQALAQAFESSPIPFLEAYPNSAWHVDNIVAIASLARHDTVLPPRYSDFIADWRTQAQSYLDLYTGLFPHRLDPTRGLGVIVDGTRGSSSSLIAYFLPYIDPQWGLDYYTTFRGQFVTTVLGVPGVREYPIGQDGAGDVDSGPLIAGISLSSTVVTAAAASANGDHEVADALLNAGEALGMPIDIGGMKRYAFGVLPIGDAFLAWAKTPDTPAAPMGGYWEIISPSWRVPIHVISMAVIVGLWWRALWRRGANRTPAKGATGFIAP